ncbi:hypothetical protein C8K36_103261 [Rhodococcus sp. OK519]|nr:hypothetical protein C8K36_103261 [Rhodococcus sp. OK519]
MRLYAPPFVDRDLLVRLFVEDHPHLQVVLEQCGLADQSRVDVLVDEPLADAVDDHAAHHHSGHQRDADLAGGHVFDRRAGGLGHHDAAAVVTAVAVDPETHQLWSVLRDHLLVVREPAGRDDHAAPSAVGDDIVEMTGDDADDTAALGDQAQRGGVGMDRHGRPCDGLAQLRHEYLAAETVGGDAVPARRGLGEFAERVGVLAHPHQAVVGGRHPGGRIPQRRLERHAVVDEPLVVGDALAAVQAYLLRVGVGAERGQEELLHRLGGVVETARLLDGGAAAEIHLAARQRRRSAAPALPFQQDHLGACGGRLECGRRSGAAVADDQDIGLVVVGSDLGSVDRGDGYACAHPVLLS